MKQYRNYAACPKSIQIRNNEHFEIIGELGGWMNLTWNDMLTVITKNGCAYRVIFDHVNVETGELFTQEQHGSQVFKLQDILFIGVEN